MAVGWSAGALFFARAVRGLRNGMPGVWLGRILALGLRLYLVLARSKSDSLAGAGGAGVSGAVSTLGSGIRCETGLTDGMLTRLPSELGALPVDRAIFSEVKSPNLG